MENNLPKIGTKEFNNICEQCFSGRSDTQLAINWFNNLSNKEKSDLETKYRTLLITDSNIKRIYKMENYGKSI